MEFKSVLDSEGCFKKRNSSRNNSEIIKKNTFKSDNDLTGGNNPIHPYGGVDKNTENNEKYQRKSVRMNTWGGLTDKKKSTIIDN